MATQNNSDMVSQILSHLNDLKQTDYGTMGDIGGAIGAYTNGNRVSDAYGNAASSAEQQAQQLQSQMRDMPTLASMYGQDSPYAKQMAMQLAAKDAAAGRNSQYGPRMQALQADLASKGSQYAQQQAAMANQYSTAMNNANNARTAATTNQAQVQGQQLGSLFKLGQSSGILPALNQGISNMAQPYIDQAKTGLGNMFGSPQPTQQQTDTYNQGGPSMGVYGQPQQEPMMDYGQGMEQPQPDNVEWYQ